MPIHSHNVPLYKALSKLGAASRTQARTWILSGDVEVNGEKCRDPERLVCPEAARIRCRGTLLAVQPTRIVLFSKPKGVITSRVDPQGRPTVYALLPQAFASWHCVGRLDAATSGLLLLTNDTRLSTWLTEPAHQIPRVYAATVRGAVSQASSAAMLDGIEESGELLRADQMELRKVSRRESHVIITLTEGKNREIRRLCKYFGHEVIRLKRIAFGGLSLGDLQPGEYRELTIDEVRDAFPGVVMRTASRKNI